MRPNDSFKRKNLLVLEKKAHVVDEEDS